MREAATIAEAIGAERPYLLRYATAKLRDAPLAEDVVQETLLAALQGAAGFEQRSTLRTWLTGILLRRIADHGRQRARRPEDPSAEPEDDADAPADAIDWIDPPRRIENRQQLDAVQRTLAAVSPQAAQLLTLRELDGLSHEDAAQRLGLSAAHAASLVHRARSRMRELIARESKRAAPGLAHVG